MAFGLAFIGRHQIGPLRQGWRSPPAIRTGRREPVPEIRPFCAQLILAGPGFLSLAGFEEGDSFQGSVHEKADNGLLTTDSG